VKAFCLLFATLVFSCSPLFAQADCLGTPEQCAAAAQSRLCAEERADANLEIGRRTMLQGFVLDQTGAVLGKGFGVQLREVPTGKVLQFSALAEDGRFRFDPLPAGNYRMIIVRSEHGSVARLKMFDQPQALRCGGSGECVLELNLTLHGTDNPIDQCPPK
jgi:hypothetical protein